MISGGMSTHTRKMVISGTTRIKGEEEAAK
jgi:hypothetical protein